MNSNPLANADTWQQLHTANTGLNTGALNTDAASRSSCTARDELNTSIHTIRQFVSDHAATGPQRANALNALDQYSKTRINATQSDLHPLTATENRKNLSLFASQLNNPTIPMERKIGAALALTEGLGVCPEGETLNILDCTQKLITQQSGMAAKLVSAKNQLLEQNLLLLVKQENPHTKEMEIHHVQALKNHVAHQWGMPVIQDIYATTSFQHQAGDMASALLNETVTAQALASQVTDDLSQALINLSGMDLRQGAPSSELRTEPLRRAIQAEFGEHIDLEHCLEFSDDYSTVKLKDASDIRLHVLQAFKALGALPANTDLNQINAQKPRNTHDVMKTISHLRNEPVRRAPSGISIPIHVWFGHGLTQHQQEEQDKKKKTMTPTYSFAQGVRMHH